MKKLYAVKGQFHDSTILWGSHMSKKDANKFIKQLRKDVEGVDFSVIKSSKQKGMRLS